MVMPTPVPYLATSGVAPAPCFARARPGASMFGGVNLFVSSSTHFAGPHAPTPMGGAARGRLRYGIMKPPLALGDGRVGRRPPQRGPSPEARGNGGENRVKCRLALCAVCAVYDSC